MQPKSLKITQQYPIPQGFNSRNLNDYEN